MKFEFDAIGTKWQIDIYENPGGKPKDHLINQIKSRIEIFDQAYSRFRSDSLITKMSLRKGVYNLPDDAQTLFDL